MAKLRHIAINCDDMEKDATFFKKAFELEEIQRVGTLQNGAIYLSDGIMNVALIKMSDPNFPNAKLRGLNHIGFVVKDLPKAVALAEEAGAVSALDPNAKTEGSGVTWEVKMKGPSGVDFDLSDHGWPGISAV